MEANDLIARLKADTPEKYKCDLSKVLTEYKLNLNKLPPKDHGLFGLNILRTLCWNLDKAPIWRETVDETTLLTLTIDCIRVTRQINREDRVKTLACIYHIHKYAVRVNKPIPPELILKVSVMPFELDSKHLLKEYYKTYWHILADRFMYIEKLKTKVNIGKLLPKLTEDILKIIEIYDIVEFCSTVIVFIFKKLHLLYSETEAKKLIHPFKQIFTVLCLKDKTALKELKEKDIYDIYVKLNDCLYVVADNSTKMKFKDGIFDEIAQKCATVLVDKTDLFYCMQTFYVTLFSKIISQNVDMSYVEGIFNSLQIAFRDADKLNFNKALLVTYPYLNQMLRLYIEYNVTNKNTLSDSIQGSCLKLMLYFMKTLKDCKQISKCENCPKKTGLHDAFRLSLLNKHLINTPNATILDTFYLITTEQYVILADLKQLGCVNYQKFFRKLQTDIHNTAISLNKSQLYETSIKLFNLYLNNELKCTEMDHKNISRAIFNKSICELDAKLYEKALIDAFLSLTFAQRDSLHSDKYMNLVMDIKARELKSKSGDDDEAETDELQLVTVLDACKMALESKLYGDLMPFMKDLKFSELLRHEFSMYGKLWPSIAPVGGVWRGLRSLARASDVNINDENEVTTSEVLLDVLLETPTVVRTVHSPYFSTIVGELLDEFDNKTLLTPDDNLVQVALLFLQCEYDLASASQQYKWKITELNANPDEIPATRTVEREHAATRRAALAVKLLRDLSPTLKSVSKRRLGFVLQICETFVPLLLHLCRDVQALQLAYCCCLIADIVQNRESYLRNAGVLLTSLHHTPAVDDILDRAARWPRDGWGETELVFLCDVAIYSRSRGKLDMATRLLQVTQARMLDILESQPDINLDLAVGGFLEAQNILYGDCGVGPSALTAVNGALRHYLKLAITGGKWSSRRLRSLSARARTSACCRRACLLARALGLRGRARACAASALPAEPAARAASLHAEIVNVTSFNNTQVKIDEHLKHILGLNSGDGNLSSSASYIKKQPLFTPKQDLDPMRDNVISGRKPSCQLDLVTSVPAFRIPEYFNHNSKCTCYFCEIPICSILCYKTSNIEALMYAYANENEIARNYFEGFINMIDIIEMKLNNIKKFNKDVYDDFIVESVWKTYDLEFKSVVIKSLIDYAFFELKNKKCDAVDGLIVRINEVMQEMSDVDQYLKNEVLNLMVASAQLKKTSKKLDIDLDEIENLSPAKQNVEPPITPESKPNKPPELTKIIVKKEELPQKRIPIELRNLDLEDDEMDFEKPKKLTRGAKKDKFKVPNPIIPKPALEEATPRPSRTKPRILVTEPSITPKSQTIKDSDEFFTPLPATPEQFFTPITSVKTYSKRSLRHNIVKNLELELSTPTSNTGKENRRIEKTAKSLVKEDSLNKAEKTTAKEGTTIKKEDKSNSKAHSVKDARNVPGSSRSRNVEKRCLNKAESLGKAENGRGRTAKRV